MFAAAEKSDGCLGNGSERQNIHPRRGSGYVPSFIARHVLGRDRSIARKEPPRETLKRGAERRAEEYAKLRQWAAAEGLIFDAALAAAVKEMAEQTSVLFATDKIGPSRAYELMNFDPPFQTPFGRILMNLDVRLGKIDPERRRYAFERTEIAELT